MNIAEKLNAIAGVLQDEDLCAEAMVSEIGEIIYTKEDNKMDANKRPSLVLCHANGKGTGSAIKLELYPARIGDLDSGAIYATIAPQSTFGDLGSTPPIYPRFDWGNAVKVRLDFTDLAKVLQVLRGETESIDEGKGLFHRYADKCQVIKFRHIIEPVCGYSLDVVETPVDVNVQNRDRKAYILLSSVEALGLSLAIENSLAAIAFGVLSA